MHTSSNALADIERDGYVVLERLIEPDLVADVRSELSPFLDGARMGRNDFEGFKSERVYALLAKAPSIAHIIEHPVVLDIVDQLLPPNYLLSAALAINAHPGETPQDFHRDDGAGNDFLPMPRPLLGVSTIWAFDDFTATNGATEIIPGSHRWPQERQPQDTEAVKVTMPAGSVVVFAGNLMHRGGANVSTGKRLGITPQYCMPWLRQIEHMVLSVPPDIAGRYSDRVQALLGYNVIDPGFMGYVDGMHPKRLIDASYRGRKHRSELPIP